MPTPVKSLICIPRLLYSSKCIVNFLKGYRVRSILTSPTKQACSFEKIELPIQTKADGEQ